jgi:hypothetical protein
MLALLLALAVPALAQDDPLTKTAVEERREVVPSAIQGTWKREGASEREDAIEKIVSEMAWYERGVARGRLLSSTRPCDRLTVSEDKGRIRVACDERPLAEGQPGERRTWKNEEGKEYGLVLDTDGVVLTQTFIDKDGHRTNTYRAEGDVLILQTRLESPRLPRDLVYEQRFVR